MKNPFALLACIVAFSIPSAVSADTLGTQAQLISLLQTIVQLQQKYTESLSARVAELTQQLAVARAQPVSSCPASQTTTHICGIVNPPACATSLTVTRDAYNCVTGYACAATQSSPQTVVAPASVSNATCRTPRGVVYENGSAIRTDRCEWFAFGQQCVITGTAVFPLITCRNGQWYSGNGELFSTQQNTSCTFANTPAGTQCGGLYHCVFGVNGNVWSPTGGDTCVLLR